MARSLLVVPRRALSTTRPTLVDSSFENRPSPPRLPGHLQKEFEELQRRASMPLSKPSPDATAGEVEASMEGYTEESHPDLRRKPRPEFEGDINPKTGEVGGPKNDPLGYEKEWTYGGRATDF